MRMKKLFTAVLLFCVTMAFAQERQIKEESKTLFRSHWFMQLQAGAAHTVGEAKFSDLISPAAAFNVGYKFSPAFALRFGASGWQGKGWWVTPEQDYKFKYVQGNLDLVTDLSALFAGFNPNRVFNAYLFAGGGFNHAFDNDKANELDTKNHELEYLWKDSKNFIAGRFGLGCDFRLSDRVALNIEGNANVLSDKFNSKKAGNADWQLNALVGISIKLGKGYTRTEPVYYEPEPVIAPEPKPEPIVEKPEPKKEEPVVVEPMKQNIFFALNSALIQEDQQQKITLLADYLEKYPEAKVNVTGYADKETGNPKINSKLSEARANNVAEALKARGVAAERIVVDFKGDTIQPYATPEENRVSICITE
ncbi:major outer membrane protein OmpA [Bacteroides pyogenes JCM 6292]|uniref:Major outer membrane protein OmpA n=2 Tax=Bacteroides pyogenes TaxID=310300 RepID=W4PNA0_9BACE|nr:OmpA family protein [Bacteroides pyogenes]GAE17201.1 major outer membrane protein OmpA [Bacteroides pyogenes JCM 6292]GAE20589.1 major outer membrane protein OmpA [Bacteroides pyogenes DSM 20611 = JCM 6294]